MDYAIITGASRGLGAAIAAELLQPSHTLFCISRTVNSQLIADSEREGIDLYWIQADLARHEVIPEFMRTISERVDPEQATSVTLINNGAMLGPLGPVGTADTPDVARAVAVNLTAPMVMTHLFVRLFGNLLCPKTVMTISSGAAREPMRGLSTYATTKAGVNMFARAAASDLDGGDQVRFLSVSPGTVDTAMQDELRNAGPDTLPDHETYVGWKTGNRLVPPREAARRVLSLLNRTDVENGSYVHARELEQWR